jgi:putative DNA primase/helicase
VSWTSRSAETATYDRVIALHKEGLKPNDIASELDVNKSTVSRRLRVFVHCPACFSVRQPGV